MSYVNVEDVLPEDIIKLIQTYVDGKYIYIPRKKSERKSWGEETNTRAEIKERNINIYSEHIKGKKVEELSKAYFLSKKSIYRIILQQKKKLESK